MKLCIPITEGEGAGAVLCEHFGSAPAFALYDQVEETYEVLGNPKADHEHGQCRPMDLLANRSIAAMVCKGMGRGAVTAVEQTGIKVYTTTASTAGGAIAEFDEGKRVKLDPENSCTGLHCH